MSEEKNDEAPKYGVRELATLMDLEPATVRVQLRRSRIAKAGKSYGWKTKGEMEKVRDTLRSNSEAAERAVKSAAKKPSKKPTSKK